MFFYLNLLYGKSVLVDLKFNESHSFLNTLNLSVIVKMLVQPIS